MTIFLTGFVRCPCGKIHTRGGVNINSVCTCGRGLYELAFDIKRRPSAIETAKAVAKELAARQGN